MVHIATINAATVFEDVVTRVSNGIPQIMALSYTLSNRIDEEAYRKFEDNNPVGSLFAEACPDPAFQITAVQWNQLFSVFGGTTATRTEF